MINNSEDNARLYNCHSKALNLMRNDQITMNETIVATMELYIASYSKSTFENNVDFKHLTQNHIQEYIQFGINLIWEGICADLIEVLMQNNFEIIMNFYKTSKSEADINTVRMQLLFIKQAIRLLHMRDFERYFVFAGQFTSASVPINLYKDILYKKI